MAKSQFKFHTIRIGCKKKITSEYSSGKRFWNMIQNSHNTKIHCVNTAINIKWREKVNTKKRYSPCATLILCRFCIESTNRRLNIWMGISEQIERPFFVLFCRLILFARFFLVFVLFRMVFNCYLTRVRDSIVSHFENYSQLFLKQQGSSQIIIFFAEVSEKKENHSMIIMDPQWISKVILYALARLLYRRTSRE